MSSAITTALNGLVNQSQDLARNLTSMVKDSSTGNLDAVLVSLPVAETNIKADAAVIRAVNHTQKSLLDIKV